MQRSPIFAAMLATAAIMSGCVTVKNYIPAAPSEPSAEPAPPAYAPHAGEVITAQPQTIVIPFTGDIALTSGSRPNDLRAHFAAPDEKAVADFDTVRREGLVPGMVIVMKRAGSPEEKCAVAHFNGKGVLGIAGRDLIVGRLQQAMRPALQSTSCVKFKVGQIVRLAPPPPPPAPK